MEVEYHFEDSPEAQEALHRAFEILFKAVSEKGHEKRLEKTIR